MATLVPFLVKHVAMAIYESGDVHGKSPTQKITGALDIARHRLVEYGFLRKGSETGPVEEIRLTVKGLKREQKHKYHGPKTKNQKFDRLFDLIADAHDSDEDESTDDDPRDVKFHEDGPLHRKQRTQSRHAHAAKRAAKPRKRARVPPARVRRVTKARRR